MGPTGRLARPGAARCPPDRAAGRALVRPGGCEVSCPSSESGADADPARTGPGLRRIALAGAREASASIIAVSSSELVAAPPVHDQLRGMIKVWAPPTHQIGDDPTASGPVGDPYPPIRPDGVHSGCVPEDPVSRATVEGLPASAEHGADFEDDPCPGRWPFRRVDICTLETRSATTPGVAMQSAAVPIASRRAVLRFPTLARLASRLLVLDLADQVCTHVREGMFDVALVGGGHEVRPSR